MCPRKSVQRYFSMREAHKANLYDEVDVNRREDTRHGYYIIWGQQDQSR